MGEKIAAIVLAAGEGKRMGSGIPKAVPGNSGTSCFILFFKMFSGESFDS